MPTLIVDRNPRPGDAWRNRYKSLCLHDPVWYDHLPYLPFPDHWPIYTPKDKMGDWLESYAKIMELDYWTLDHVQERVVRRGQGANGRSSSSATASTVTLKPKQLVLATGMSGFPEIPTLSRRRDASRASSIIPATIAAARAGPARRCVVVGSNNSAHDIAADLWEHGADVTMLQRSPTLVVRAETLARNRPLYSEEAVASGITTEIADLTAASMPYGALPKVHRSPMVEQIRREDADFYDAAARRRASS